MTSAEKRQALVVGVIGREGKNKYTQGDKRDQVLEGWSDCSSLMQRIHELVLSINIGSNTEAQIRSKSLTTIDANIKDGIPDESRLLPGDLLYFRGRNEDRKDSQYVGHVEMYVGNGEISGHGSGVGPTRKNMVEYCTMRQNSKVDKPIYNRGLICVRRAIPAGASDHPEWEEYLAEIYVSQLGRLPDAQGTAFWIAQLESGKTWDEVAEGIEESIEGQQRFVTELYTYLLNRKPDKAGLEDWVGKLQAGMSRADVFRGFIGSEEYKNKH